MVDNYVINNVAEKDSTRFRIVCILKNIVFLSTNSGVRHLFSVILASIECFTAILHLDLINEMDRI